LKTGGFDRKIAAAVPRVGQDAAAALNHTGDLSYTMPWAIMESATFTKPAILAPAT
jgi:hypothetical protein